VRVVDRGYVSALQSQATWYGIAAAMHADDEPVLTLVNPLEPYVCIGLHQDIALEVDEAYCRSHGIGVLRRRLGGGAVYIDRDQLIFHFIYPRRQAPERAAALYPRFIEPVVRTYRALGIAAVYRPVNDIQVDGRKIGGTAAAILEEATVLGGMFLFDFNAATMARCLKVPSEKFRDKLHKGLDGYVTSMRRLLPSLPSRDAVKALFLRHIGETLGVVPRDAELAPAEQAAIEGEMTALADPAWAGKVGRRFVPQGVKLAAGTFLTEGMHKAAGGLVRVRLLAHDGRIADLEISGDFTCTPAAGLELLAGRLIGHPLDGAAFDPAIDRAIADLGLQLPGVAAADLAAAIATATPESE
jgi:lipoate---protein ligase